ncbi:MAG TPA: hypothetical protein VH594_25435 [Trebonia sp.]
MEDKMSTPAGDSAFLSELEIEVRTELIVAEVGQPTVAADTGLTDTGPAVERLLDPDAEAYADAERYEVSLRTLLGAIEAVEDGPEPDHQP